MKKNINIFFAAILTTMVLSCQNKMDNIEEYEAIAPEFSADASFLNFSENETYKMVNVTAKCSWKASSRDSWINILPAEGKGNGSITVILERNTPTAARTGTFTITNGITSVEIVLSQATSAFRAPTVGTVTTEVQSKNSVKCTFYFNSTDLVVSAHGVCYSHTIKEPTIENSTKTLGQNVNSGTVSFLLTNLVPNTTYYVRAYATTNRGTEYGSVSHFTTLNISAPGDEDNPQPSY